MTAAMNDDQPPAEKTQLPPSGPLCDDLHQPCRAELFEMACSVVMFVVCCRQPHGQRLLQRQGVAQGQIVSTLESGDHGWSVMYFAYLDALRVCKGRLVLELHQSEHALKQLVRADTIRQHT